MNPLSAHARSLRLTLLLAPALGGLVGLSLLVSACGGSPAGQVAQLGSTTTDKAQSSPSATTPGQSRQDAALAFSRCMRSHGVPNFPDPDSQGDFPSSIAGVSKQSSAAANDACKHVLSRGGTGTPQQRQQKLVFGLKVSQCLRTHGYPDFPDPTGSGVRLPPGINTDASRFESAQTACEKREQQVLGLP